MKKFLKNPYNLAWIILLGLIVVLIIVVSFVPAIFRVVSFLIGAECIYSAVLMIIHRKKNKINLDEFENQEATEKKKFSFLESEGKINSLLFICFLFIVGVIFVYLTFK